MEDAAWEMKASRDPPACPPPLNPTQAAGIWGSALQEEGACQVTTAPRLGKADAGSWRAGEEQREEAGCTFLEVQGVQTMSSHMHYLPFKISL